jgi:glycosyltransferase involved in cell wall biosynthesis
MTDTAGRTTVVHIVENLEVGGLERVVINLMTHVDAGRYRSVLYCLGHGGALVPEVEAAGHPVRCFGKKPGMDWILLSRIARALREDGAAIVHPHNFSPLVYGSLGAAVTPARGVVYTAHGAKTSGRRKQLLFQRLGLVDEIVFVSADARRVALECGAVRPAGTRTIVNGIEIGRYEGAPDREKIRSGFGIPPGSPVLGIVARLTPAKDHAMLFRAFSRVRERYPGARLLIVGDGELGEELKADVADLGLNDGVIFTGARRDVPSLLSAMDVFVLSSYTEGLAMTLLEAMAARLPVVATSVGGNAEAVADGETGIIVPPHEPKTFADTVIGLLGDPGAMQRMGTAGLARARRQFSTEAMVKSYVELYEGLTA